MGIIFREDFELDSIGSIFVMGGWGGGWFGGVQNGIILRKTNKRVLDIGAN